MGGKCGVVCFTGLKFIILKPSPHEVCCLDCARIVQVTMSNDPSAPGITCHPTCTVLCCAEQCCAVLCYRDPTTA